MVLVPLSGLVSIITAQAVKVGQSVTPWVQRQIAQPAAFSEYLQRIPFYDEILPYHEQIISKAGELASKISVLLVNSLSAGRSAPVNFIFISLFSVYQLLVLIDGRILLNRILYYQPLEKLMKNVLLERFTR